MTTQLVEIEKSLKKIDLPIVSDSFCEQYEKAGFLRAANLLRAVKNYKVLTKPFLTEWVRSLNKYEIPIDEFKRKDITLIENHSTGGYRVVLDCKSFEIQPVKNAVTSQLVQRGLKMHQVSIVETPLSNYQAVPPPEILPNVMRAKGIFDEMVVVEPKVEEAEKKPLIDDPLLCGKINGVPDTYFLVDYWVYDFLRIASDRI